MIKSLPAGWMCLGIGKDEGVCQSSYYCNPEKQRLACFSRFKDEPLFMEKEFVDCLRKMDYREAYDFNKVVENIKLKYIQW